MTHSFVTPDGPTSDHHRAPGRLSKISSRVWSGLVASVAALAAGAGLVGCLPSETPVQPVRLAARRPPVPLSWVTLDSARADGHPRRVSEARRADRTTGNLAGHDDRSPVVTVATEAPPTDSDRSASGTTPAAGATPSGLGSKPAPIREPLLEGWERPDVALVLTGNQNGYIEPCGCTGLENQKGGLARRHRLVTTLQQKGWPIVALDVGNQIRRTVRQAEIKYQMTAEALGRIGYDAVTFGPDDLQLSSGDLASLTAAYDERESIFVAANVAILDRSLTPRVKVIERGGHRIGITGVVGASGLKTVQSDEILQETPESAVAVALEALKAQRCDTLVLLAQATMEETKALATRFPDFQLVVTGGGGGEPEFLPTSLNGGRTYLIQTGAKGMYVGVVGIYPGRTAAERFRYERVALDARFEDSPAMLRILADYQKQLEVNGFAGLGIKALPHPTGHTYVGSHKCGECHTSAMAVWEGSKHSHALETLIQPGERTEIQRHHDPECLSCHVTGWNPQKYYPYEGGYWNREKTALLGGVGCENCHGPGSQHVAAEEGTLTGNAASLQAKFREAMRLPLAQAERVCIECHDHDNSPDFHEPGAFERYWQEVEHYGTD